MSGTPPGADDRPALQRVDWAAVDAGRGVAVTRTDVVEGLVLVGYLAAFLYDYAVVANRGPTVGALGLDVTAVEWLFGAVMLLGVFHVALPLARRRRLTAVITTVSTSVP